MLSRICLTPIQTLPHHQYSQASRHLNSKRLEQLPTKPQDAGGTKLYDLNPRALCDGLSEVTRLLVEHPWEGH